LAAGRFRIHGALIRHARILTHPTADRNQILVRVARASPEREPSRGDGAIARWYRFGVPAEAIHLTALREAIGSRKLDGAVIRRVTRHEDAARLGALLVDLPYYHKFRGEVVRYVLGMPPKPSAWGDRLHEGGAVALLNALLEVARDAKDETMGAVALGLASHLAIDRALHPLINALARRYPVGWDHGASHREAEKFQSICFHETYFGRDLMGTSALVRHLAIDGASRLAAAELARPILAAFVRAFRSAPDGSELAGFGRGYATHVRLLGSPLGRRVAPPPAKEAARPRYLRGAWGAFSLILEEAIVASIAVINATGEVLEASDRDHAAAVGALERVLPPGSIDPDGTDVDLDAPYAITLLARSGVA
jgi:hypothetical protein